MQLVHVYLNFPGTTEEAFRFYETVFGTRISMMQTFGETSFMPNVPEAAKNKIMHVQLPITETVLLMGSDAVEGFGPPLKVGNNFHISIVAKDKAEADRAFAALSAGGACRDAARERAVGAVLRHVRRSLRRAVDGQPAEPRLRWGRARAHGNPGTPTRGYAPMKSPFWTGTPWWRRMRYAVVRWKKKFGIATPWRNRSPRNAFDPPR